MATRETWYWDPTREPDYVSLRSCINTDEYNADFSSEIHPGETACGLTYEEWRMLPEGLIGIVLDGGQPISVVAPAQ